VGNDKLDRTIAKLRAEYAEHLPLAVADIEAQWRQLLAGEVPWSRLGELVHKAHSIAGAGKTFGFADASRLGRELELLLEPHAQAGRVPDAQAQQAVANMLVELGRAAIQT